MGSTDPLVQELRERAYAPHSRFKIGAAAVTGRNARVSDDGKEMTHARLHGLAGRLPFEGPR